jgi:hypothetical protein
MGLRPHREAQDAPPVHRNNAYFGYNLGVTFRVSPVSVTRAGIIAGS